jgi:hypothetical protein
MKLADLPYDTARIKRVLKQNISSKMTDRASYALAIEDLDAGRLDMMTMLRITNCGRKAKQAVNKDLHHQYFELSLGKK